MLYNGPPIQQQGTLRTQGNNYLEIALKQKDEERKNNLIQALSCYNKAIEMKVEPDADTTEQEITEKQAIMFCNRAEVYRLL